MCVMILDTVTLLDLGIVSTRMKVPWGRRVSVFRVSQCSFGHPLHLHILPVRLATAHFIFKVDFEQRGLIMTHLRTMTIEFRSRVQTLYNP